MSLVYLCDSCTKIGQPERGDQRDPGPFAPAGWATLSVRGPKGEMLHLCPACVPSPKTSTM